MQKSDYGFLNDGLERLLQKCNGLVDFNFIKRYGGTITEDLLTFLGTFCPHLEFVSITGILCLSESVLEYFIESCTRLKRVEFNNGFNETNGKVYVDFVLKCTGTNCTQLESLE